MPELRLVEVADEHVELALVKLTDDEYDFRLRVLVGYYFSLFPTRNAGLYAIRFRTAGLDGFLRDLDAGRQSRHVSVDRRKQESIAILQAPSDLPMRDVVLQARLMFGMMTPPLRTTISGVALEQLRDYHRRYLRD